MMDRHKLTRHHDIKNWVSEHRGLPAMSRIPGPSGEVRARLALHFGHPKRVPQTPTCDDGVMPVSWKAWLAEFDRQQLALMVSPRDTFELVDRKDLTTD